MVNIREKVFLISGVNFWQRQQVIANLKRRIFQNRSATLNVFTFYSKEIDIKDLAAKVFTVTFGKNKIIIFRNFHELTPAVKNFLLANLKKMLLYNYIIFDTDKEHYQLQRDKKFTSDSFFTFILKRAAVFKVNSPRENYSQQDLREMLRKNDLASSLSIVEYLFKDTSKERILGPQIIGMLVKKYSYLKDSRQKQKYFEYLWEADRALKEKGISARLVIEALLVKLFTFR